MNMRTATAFALACIVCCLAAVMPAYAQGSGAVRGTVKDSTGGVTPGATVTLKSMVSAWMQTTQTDLKGEFVINAVPFGQYTATVDLSGFTSITQPVQIAAGQAPNLTFTLQVAGTETRIEVTAPLDETAASAPSPPVMVSGQEILEALPGANRMSSLAFVTDVTPGAFVLHDHLHVRGGHQIDYVVNGVPVPNTNMSSNVGRQMDPMDIEQVQVNRGGYGAESGDRTFAQVNIQTRNGFEFNNEGTLNLSYGSFHQTNDQVGFGGHSNKFAYYVSAAGNFTDLGLEPPEAEIAHAQGSGENFFTNMSYRPGAKDQIDWTAVVRNDNFEIPVDPHDLDPTSTSFAGLRDRDVEKDSFITASWTHTISTSSVLVVAPFYHYNNGKYTGGANDLFKADSQNVSNYAGSEVDWKYVRGAHNFVAGFYGFYQHNRQFFSLDDTTTANAAATVSAVPTGGVGAIYANEQYKANDWLTLTGGVRATHFKGTTTENVVNPRAGATIELPTLKWVIRGYAGQYYQAPPLYTVGGGVFGVELAGSEDFGFLPLAGERDVQLEGGLTIPIHGWDFDMDYFHTKAKNFLDHDVLGNSNILLPLTTPHARMFGEELNIKSPPLAKAAQFHFAFSHMNAEYMGQPSGGLISPVPDVCLVSWCPLDHDQRYTVTTGVEVRLPSQAYASTNITYGSGFLLEDGPDYLPRHTLSDILVGKQIKDWNLNLTVLNLFDKRFPFDVNNSFAGNHFNNPREIIGAVRFRFHY